ncbi:hypothetical protein MMC24_004542 [Lignoscripta atroalba]|nr:hypothetical protein [Lignoscripta atroalba]
MLIPAPSAAAYMSPKRKRDPEESDYTASLSPSPMRLKTNLPVTPLESELAGGGSPRTVVAGQLQALDLQKDGAIPKLDFRRGSEGCKEASSTNSLHQSESGFRDIVINSPGHIIVSTTGNPTAPHPSDPPHPRSAGLCPESDVPEIPSTPNLQPAESPPPPLPTTSPQPHARRKSPPPLRLSQPDDDPLTWHDSEITGHDPKDPSDDGYGINGIGFRPTPAMAHARAQRRKQQVAEWKNREAREARQRRSERRRGGASSDRVGQGHLESQEQLRKVRFVEG